MTLLLSVLQLLGWLAGVVLVLVWCLGMYGAWRRTRDMTGWQRAFWVLIAWPYLVYLIHRQSHLDVG